MKKKTVLHIPHSSMFIPLEYKEMIMLCEEDLERELLWMTDRFTEELFQHPQTEKVVNPVSRLIFDPERFLEGEPMEKVGMGICYSRTHDGRVLKKVSESHRREIVDKYYHPHHQELFEKTRAILEQCGEVLVVDCHSFSPFPLPYEPIQDKVRPDICIGTDCFHTPKWLEERVLSYFRSLGYTAALNSPYAGTIVPLPYLEKEKGVQSIMIELNRSLYMDPFTGEKTSHFETLKKELQVLL